MCAHGPTLLAGLVRCSYCDAAMIQNTGKGGAYRYYCCSRKLKEGAGSCRGIRMRMEKLDDTVISVLCEQILRPSRLQALLSAFLQASVTRDTQDREKLSRMRKMHSEAEAGIGRLLGLVEKGLMEAEDPALREKLIGLKLQRDELSRDVHGLQQAMSAGSMKPATTSGGGPSGVPRWASLPPGMKSARSMAVSVGPMHRAFTRMLSSASACAAASVSPFSAHLEAL